jgi:branched-chain amino acid transport system ATP-binding protein
MDKVMAEPVLELSNLTKSFGALRATDDVSLDLRPGEIHALIGPNGAGKSTLIHQICGTLRQDAGTIRLAGEDIGALNAAERARRGLGRTFQISSLAPDFSALRNVMLAVQAQAGSSFRFFKPVMRDTSLIDRSMAMLERVGLADRARIPAAELSHGERRQLEIAIALALDSKAFLLDEPMAGMGPEGSKTLTGFLDGLRQEAPILLVEHDMDAVFALADRISVLVYGKVIATGTVDDIRGDPAVRTAYLGDHP